MALLSLRIGTFLCVLCVLHPPPVVMPYRRHLTYATSLPLPNPPKTSNNNNNLTNATFTQNSLNR